MLTIIITITFLLWKCTLFLVFGMNSLVYDFSTSQSCDKIHIFRLTLTWSGKMTLFNKIRLRLGTKFTFLLSMQRCGQGRKCVLDLIDSLWGLIVNVCLALNECLHYLFQISWTWWCIWRRIRLTLRRQYMSIIVIPPTEVRVISPFWIVWIWTKKMCMAF